MPFFIPLGIPDFNGKKERDFFQFTYHIEDNDACELIVQIRNGNIVWYEETITDTSKLTQGEHIWQWDGFDNDGILDTAKFTQAKRLNFYATGKDNDGNIDRSSTDFEANYDEVNWVDVKIDKPALRIDITLRVNLIDGGENGTEKDCKEMGKARNAPVIKICPWDKIPKEALSFYKEAPLESKTKTFEQLKEMVLDGVNTYWSRRYTNTEGTIINDTNWEIIVTAVNTEDSNISLNDIPLIYNTNSPWSRSGNTGGNYNDSNWDDEAMGLLPNGLVQRISFNAGYIQYSDWKDLKKTHWLYKLKGWQFYDEINEIEEFKETSAHEIGHEIIQAFGGTAFSWQHKGSSYYFPQNKKPTGKESFIEEHLYIDYMEDTKGEKYPEGEIDLMKYYNGSKPNDFYNRRVANETDVLSLISLTKIELK